MLMSIAILLLCLLLESVGKNEQPKVMRVVEKSKKTPKDAKDE